MIAQIPIPPSVRSFPYTQANVPDVEPVNTQPAEEKTKDQGGSRGFSLTCKLHIELHSLFVRQILLSRATCDISISIVVFSVRPSQSGVAHGVGDGVRIEHGVLQSAQSSAVILPRAYRSMIPRTMKHALRPFQPDARCEISLLVACR